MAEGAQPAVRDDAARGARLDAGARPGGDHPGLRRKRRRWPHRLPQRAVGDRPLDEGPAPAPGGACRPCRAAGLAEARCAGQRRRPAAVGRRRGCNAAPRRAGRRLLVECAKRRQPRRRADHGRGCRLERRDAARARRRPLRRRSCRLWAGSDGDAADRPSSRSMPPAPCWSESNPKVRWSSPAAGGRVRRRCRPRSGRAAVPS